MPALSKSQQQAAAIALHAPKSELRGASKQMATSMSKGELRKFAKTERTSLPKYVKDSVEQIKAMISEGRHKVGCTCGFCKNMGKGFGKKKEEVEPEEPKESPMSEGQDDIGKLNMSPEAKHYARRGGLASMKRQPKDYVNMVAADTNQKGKKAGFRNFDAAEKPSGGSMGASPGLTKKKNESLAQEVVDTMLNG
jgi:hypothetical protein